MLENTVFIKTVLDTCCINPVILEDIVCEAVLHYTERCFCHLAYFHLCNGVGLEKIIKTLVSVIQYSLTAS